MFTDRVGFRQIAVSSARIFRRVVGEVNMGPSKTIQSGKEEADINTLVKRFGLTGTMPQNVRVPLNGDFNGVYDFQTAMNVLVEAQQGFMQMPADIRSRFGNDPGRFVDFVSNPENQDEARKLGIALPAIVEDSPAPVEVRIVNPPSEEPKK